jgi:hypothetical protein
MEVIQDYITRRRLISFLNRGEHSRTKIKTIDTLTDFVCLYTFGF